MSSQFGTSNLSGVSAELVTELAQLVSASNKFLLLSHENPDADAFGSTGGLGFSLRAMGKEVVFANHSVFDSDLNFIAGVTETKQTVQDGFEPDVILVCDCGSLDRVGEALKAKVQQFSSHSVLVNIDHHISNDMFGKLNIVDCKASSTSEIIVALIEQAGWPFDAEVATALYAGILTDTGSFRYSCVRPYTFSAASRCFEHGADVSEIAKEIYSQTSVEKEQLQAKVMQKMQMHCQGKLVFLVVSQEDMEQTSARINDAEGLAEKGRDLKGVVVSVLFKQDLKVEHGQKHLIWRVSMRSKSDNIDLSAVAQSFGGGGHKAASGFRFRREIEELQSRLLAMFEPMLKT